MRAGSPSLPAITVSVASSPIFFRIASSPLANSDATYEPLRVRALARLDRRGDAGEHVVVAGQPLP